MLPVSPDCSFFIAYSVFWSHLVCRVSKFYLYYLYLFVLNMISVSYDYTTGATSGAKTVRLFGVHEIAQVFSGVCTGHCLVSV
jgi:hypothetical protein